MNVEKSSLQVEQTAKPNDSRRQGRFLVHAGYCAPSNER
jgi:starvation-inducible outer membrane lipoprotein